MRSIVYLMVLSALVMSCNEGVATNSHTPINPHVKEILVDSLDGEYKEWYPGRSQLKFQGSLDQQGRRHGIWMHYLESGLEKSMSTYTHGSREGFSIVRYDNGTLFYRGEYQNDLKTGLWTTYDPQGNVKSEINYETQP